jgi:hypothetical protein
VIAPEPGGLAHRGGEGFDQNSPGVGLDGVDASAQLVGNLLVLEALVVEVEDPLLSGR